MRPAPPLRASTRLAKELPLLEITPAVAEIVEAYVQHRLMPADPSFDALHLALASYHKCEFLVTSIYQHLANANKFGHIRRRTNASTGRLASHPHGEALRR